MKKSNRINTIAIFFGIVATIISFGTRVVTADPFDLIHKLNCADLLPPIRLLNFLSTVWFFLAGYAAGSMVYRVFKRRICGSMLLLTYKGGLFFLCGFFFSLSWYPVFFGAGKIFLAFLMSFFAAVLFALCALIWARIAPTVSLILAAYAFWLVYVFMLILTVFFNC